LYYAKAVDPTFLMPLNDIATEQNKATKKAQAATNQLLDYLATHPDATLIYHASDMILHNHSDASYLSVSNIQNGLGGLFFLGNKSPEQDKLNGSILNFAAVEKRGRPRCIIQSWSMLSQRPKWRPAQSHTHRAGAHTTSDASTHRQLHCIRNIERNNQTETIKKTDMRYHWLTDRVGQK
jgi:hypothetical protein